MTDRGHIALVALLLVMLAGCRSKAERIRDPARDLITEQVASPDGKKHTLVGKASWYGKKFHGRTTACGEPFDMYAFTAAHKTLPFHTIVRVTDPATRKSVVVRITDRGPYSKGRVIDLSWAAATDLGMVERGIVPVELTVLQWGTGKYIRE